MDKHKLLDKVCQQFGSLQVQNPPMRIDWMGSVAWHLLFERDNTDFTCLVYLRVENRIGIADAKVKDYTPTPCCIYEGVDGEKAVQWFNENILGHTFEQSQKIILSTFGKVKRSNHERA